MTEVYSNKDSINNLVEQVEITWRSVIIDFLEQLYFNKWIPSHDIKHHQRVWLNAVEICSQLQEKSILTEQAFYEELIICCFFHDTGLLIDTGEQHGKESRRIAENFLSTYSGKIGFDKSALLNAIEKHDDKNYPSVDDKDNLLLEILSLADDIDALGATGLYRYIEIYLVRGIDANKIPQLILSNVEKRYANLERCLKKYNISPKPYLGRYNDLVYLLSEPLFSESSVSLVKWINNEIVSSNENPDKIITTTAIRSLNQRIIEFAQKYVYECQMIGK